MRVLISIAVHLLAVTQAFAGHGAALLIGNASSPATELSVLATSLREQGYATSVEEEPDADQLRFAIEQFVKTTPTHGVALLYLAGGLEEGGVDGILKLIGDESAAAMTTVVIDGAFGHPKPPADSFENGHLLLSYAKSGTALRLAEKLRDKQGDLSLAMVAVAAEGGAWLSRDQPASHGSIDAAVAPPGEIRLGARAGDQWVNPDGTVFCWCPGAAEGTPGLWLGKYELSKREFDLVTPMRPQRALASSPAHPRDGIRYDDILQFITLLNQRERFYQRLPADWEYALPSEAEWEYACRAGSTSRFSFGDEIAKLPENANFADRQLFETGDDYYHYANRRFDDGAAKLSEVGRYPANAWGFHDMHGNLWEWTADLKPAAHLEKPAQPVARGGSWASLPNYCESGFRHQFDREEEQDFIGFRLALRPKRNTGRPNVLFLVVDDMKDWVNGLHGYKGRIHTPNIDRLAARGRLFSNAHCASPKCAPSRAATLTGLRPSTTGLYDNGHWWLPNLPDVVTIPAHFRSNGYRVAGAGKIFHHTAGNHPPNQWDDFQRLTFRDDPWFRGAKLNYPWSQHAPYPDGFPFSGVKGLEHENDWGVLDLSAEDYDDVRSADYAIKFLRESMSRSEEQPFFLACGLFRPHLPWYAPQQYLGMYELDEIVLPEVKDDDLGDLPTGGLKFAKARRGDFETITKAGAWEHAVHAYLASISFADAQIGRVLDTLDETGQAGNTVIVLWSDHGWHLGEKQHWHKSTLWEEATRVPFIVAAPGFEPGECSRPVSLIDLFPTLNELCDLPSFESHDGASLAPLLRDPQAEWTQPAVIEYLRGNAAVRSERYRYIRYSDGGEELYDHESDPNEWHNLAGEEAHTGVKRELADWIAHDWAKSAPTKSAFRFDPQTFTWTNKKTGTVVSGKETK